MLKRLGRLEIRKSADYYDKVVKSLEDSGYTVVLDVETSTERYYIVAKEDKEWSEYKYN